MGPRNMRTAPKAIALGLAAFSFAATGCGGQSDEDKVRETTLQFSKAFVDGDDEQVCDLLSSEAKSQLVEGAALLGGGSCPKLMAVARGFMDKADLKKLEDMKIRKVTIDGNTATVETTASSAGEDPTRLIKKDGEWLIAADPSSKSQSDSSSSDSSTDDQTVGTDAATPDQTSVNVGEPLRQDDYTVTVTSVKTAKKLPGNDYTAPVKADGQFTILALRVRNTGKKKATFDTTAVELVDADGTVYSSDTGGGGDQIGALPDYLDEREIQPKTSETGAVAFDLPKVANVVKAQFASSLNLFNDDFTGAVTIPRR